MLQTSICSQSQKDTFVADHCTKQEFIAVLKKSDCLLDDKHFDMQKYALFYCKQDVIVLQKCVQKFAQLLKNKGCFDKSRFPLFRKSKRA
ncbi:DNA_polymerase [Hexamita inflata]|uniref:DNA polymerase n=1 Tax=Hexamita inflata TaxID=28002 RepID=A0AA86PSK6_9EUKA|nr:DNA polymerase [Hexamita inflata]